MNLTRCACGVKLEYQFMGNGIVHVQHGDNPEHSRDFPVRQGPVARCCQPPDPHPKVSEASLFAWLQEIHGWIGETHEREGPRGDEAGGPAASDEHARGESPARMGRT